MCIARWSLLRTTNYLSRKRYLNKEVIDLNRLVITKVYWQKRNPLANYIFNTCIIKGKFVYISYMPYYRSTLFIISNTRKPLPCVIFVTKSKGLDIKRTHVVPSRLRTGVSNEWNWIPSEFYRFPFCSDFFNFISLKVTFSDNELFSSIVWHVRYINKFSLYIIRVGNLIR